MLAAKPARGESSRLLIAGAAVVAALYFGGEVFVPIVLAILLSFVLAPGVRLLRGAHLGRVVPVLLMTLLACVVIFGLSAVLALQLRDLANQLPQYQATITGKVDALRSMMSDGAFSRISDILSSLSHSAPTLKATTQSLGAPAQEPMPVTIRQPDPTPLETLASILRPLLHPLAMGGIVMVFVVFILLQRDDLRNRMIRIAGAGDIHRSTAAIDDAARRLSRYLVSQLGVNTLSGLVVGLALWGIGVPTPGLWGVLFGCLRFVPYVGPPLAAVPPIVLAAAVSPGWSVALWTLATFVAIEAVVGQVIEPFLYGHNTGLSPVAVVMAATFWTALWGPIGLLLSTPMTVCLVVLGRHVERLKVLDLLLGDQPPLEPAEIFYQRMLAEDPIEASDHARQILREKNLADYYDEVVLPALLLAIEDVRQGRLDLDRQQRIAQTTAEVVEDLEGGDVGLGGTAPSGLTRAGALIERIAHSDAAKPAAAETGAETEAGTPALAPSWREHEAVLCVGSRGPLDDAAALLLAQLLRARGFGADKASFETLLKANAGKDDLSHARLIVLSCLDTASGAYLRFVLRRLRRKAPRARIVIGAWWRSDALPGVEDPPPDDGVGDGRAATLGEALALCLGHASAESDGQDSEEAPAAPLAQPTAS